MGSHILTVVRAGVISSLNMSIKIVDILKVCKQRRVEQALGIVEPRNRYGGVERTANMQLPPAWNSPANTESSSSTSTSSFSTSSSTTSTSPLWNTSNAARFEEGTTFYSQVRKRN